MTMLYLWENRERPALLSRKWVKVWAKRVLNAPGLLSIVLRRAQYRAMGAEVGNLSVVCRLDLNGSAVRLSIGESSFVGANVHLALHDRIVVGDRVVINNNVQLLTASHDTNDATWSAVTKPIVIEDHVWVAWSAIILPGVTIGKGAVVGAGAVVTRDVPPYTVVAGNPAKVVSQRCMELTYDPVAFCAPLEAWLGKPGKKQKEEDG